MSEVKMVRSREEVERNHKWNIDKVYGSADEWEKDFELLKRKAPSLSQYAGKLSSSKALLEYLQVNEEVSRLADKVFVYAHLRSDEDTANTDFQSMKNRIDSYMAELKGYQAFFVPEILELGIDKIMAEIDDCPELRLYEFMIQDILHLKAHTLSKEQEELLASVSDCLEAPGNIFGMLSNADMTFPVIKDEEGNEVELTESNYSQFIKSKVRRVREEAFKALFNTYGKYKNTYAAALTSSIKNFIFNSKTRKFSSSLESSLKPNNIPVEVYHKSIETVNENIKSLQRYVSIKKKLLGLDQIHMYDLYVPVIDTPKEYIEFNSGVDIIREGLKPLGTEYLNIFNEGISQRWVDIYENKGKRGGAYSWGAYDTMPYILLNYNYMLNDVSTLAHEMGHSVHSYYSRKHQPYVYADYTLFCAEVASTTNEILLINYLIDNETDKTKRLYLINSELEQIRTTVFRQIMFAEFEKITHETTEMGEALTSQNLCSIWHDLNEKYFGPDMIVDSEIDMEWARIPHFYSDFYVYQYATGYAAASSFAKSILENGEMAVEKYKDFLKSGGSDYPINILKTAGVDMTSNKPLKDTIDRFNQLLDML